MSAYTEENDIYKELLPHKNEGVILIKTKVKELGYLKSVFLLYQSNFLIEIEVFVYAASVFSATRVIVTGGEATEKMVVPDKLAVSEAAVKVADVVVPGIAVPP